MTDVIVVGAGPAGVVAAGRAARARCADCARHPRCVRWHGSQRRTNPRAPALAQAARLLREARQLGLYGIAVSEPALEYPRLLARVREVVDDVRTHSPLGREALDRAGVAIHEKTGTARFIDPAYRRNTKADYACKVTGSSFAPGVTSRRLPIPGFELTSTHSDAWGLTAVPPSMLVIGGGATGVQVASIFNAFGARVQLFQAGQRILPTETQTCLLLSRPPSGKSGIAVREELRRDRVVREDADAACA